MPQLDTDQNQPQHPLQSSIPDLSQKPNNTADSENPDYSTQDPLLPQRLPQHTKDLPLTDIGTSPPAFEITSLAHKGRDSYESSELSDLDDDGSEAETDKMDFLDDEAALRDKVSDLHALLELTEMARLQGVDLDDLDDNFPKDISHEDALQLNGDERPRKQRKLQNGSEAGTQSPEAATKKVEEETENLTQVKSDADENDAVPDIENNEDEAEAEEDEALEQDNNEAEDEADGEKEEDEDPEDAEDAKDTDVKEEEEVENASDVVKEENGVLEAEADVEEDAEKQEDEDDQAAEEAAEDSEQAEADKIDEASAKEQQIAEENDVNMDEHRKLAVDELISIETDFAHLRDKLYQDKLGLLEHELQLCLDGLHPELLQIYLKVNEFYQDSIRLANATLNYSLKCINNETIALRTAIHQDFMKNVMDMKNDMITEATLLWYKVNKERNSLDQLVPDFNFTALPTIPTSDEPRGFSGPIVAGGSPMEYYLENPGMSKKAIKQNTLYELVEQRNSLNEELGILNGLTEFHGIPCAVAGRIHRDDPNIDSVDELILRKATNDEVEEDLRAMGIPIN
ncbi:hypothetical protein C7M61_002263 [Candidozyma pseudohaemuli]|uniref:Transcriptional regulatory protein DEP1 n=1 Tax=Candidozyma pseudohaemuli TaxID=418784 RepID=A0A2P7YSK8_9ASCO|nr:hypothetical protein C7M61_002263 [[Candida] pseudohaemulonii]PSK38957.1 hypothetical protein C7M61_002263 [[Candida] pseudohaemulonii]